MGVANRSIASVLFAVSPADVSYWRLPFHGMWLCVLGADLYVPHSYPRSRYSLMATAMLFVSRLALPEEQSVAGGQSIRFAKLIPSAVPNPRPARRLVRPRLYHGHLHGVPGQSGQRGERRAYRAADRPARGVLARRGV